ncbi:MAG: DUF4942 domain-containing protein, partial [Candidatus Cloacimonetes bacterium]|nr:DUF4942 domain-containing protein [Candidatus Cloacimonadota bacterium]
MSNAALVERLKIEGEDYEFYPTTNEIIRALYRHLSSVACHGSEASILDIGCGNGKVLMSLKQMDSENGGEYRTKIGQRYGIEKSRVLIESLDKDICIIGTDFREQTLIDKKVDIIFSNPPYSEYLPWCEKIILQSNCSFIYLVIPERWKNEKVLKEAISRRHGEFKVIGSFDFLNSEDRQARAKVDLVFIRVGECTYRRGSYTDPFEEWFDETFHFETSNNEISDHEQERSKREQLKAIITKENLIHELEKFYQKDMENLLNNYRAVEQLDAGVLKELGVNVGSLKKGLQKKIEGLKNAYWKELFDNLNSITNRLTSQSRERMMKKLTQHTVVDFTADNAFAVVIWVLKNANHYFDEQLKDVYYLLTQKENVIPYKSNHRFLKDEWRYSRRPEGFDKYTLDYRIVVHRYNAIQVENWRSYDYPNGLNRSAHDLIGDIFTIAANLGFSITENSFNRTWEAGEAQDFKLTSGELFASIRAYKNGNVHFKLNQKFMKKFNIE